MTQAIIIGAGVAGPVLSMALARIGVQSTIFERDAVDARHRGAWLTLQANGIDALRAIDAAGPIEELGYEVETIGCINGKGKLLGRIPLAAPRHDGLVSRMIRRADLYSALWKLAQQRGAQIEYSREFVDASTVSDGRIEARFADGMTAVGDLLIGCDGVHSRVRQIIDPSARKPRYIPVLNVGGYIPNFAVEVPPKEFRMQFGTRCFFAWMPTPDGGTVWFANPPLAKEPERGELSGMSDSDWRRWLHDLMAGDAGPAHEIIDAAPGPLVGWATYDSPVVRHWYSQQMIIIGDAAHATSPASGQGASMALEDAVILAQCLRDRRNPTDAFTLFEKLRRKRVEQIVKHGARSSNSKAAGPLGRVLRDLLLPIIFRQMAKNNGAAMNWLQGHHIEFEAKVSTST